MHSEGECVSNILCLPLLVSCPFLPQQGSDPWCLSGIKLWSGGEGVSGLSGSKSHSRLERPTSPRPVLNAFNLEEALLKPRLDYGVGGGELTRGTWPRVG